MDKATFNRFRLIIYEKSGISLGDGKEALVSARVGKRMRALGIQDYRTYLREVMEDETGTEVIHLLNAISTNVTNFFRGPDHFDFLGKAVSDWLAEGQLRFRFWSAACSTGEEPYSLAMTLLETVDGRNADVRILGTDISTHVIEHCRTGTYSMESIKDVPVAFRHRYFDRIRDGKTVLYTPKRVLKKLVVFKRLNLAAPPFPMRGPLDVIFCRNVMIYFSNSIRNNLIADMYRLLKPGGYLVVGHAESLAGLGSPFKVAKPSIYVKE